MSMENYDRILIARHRLKVAQKQVVEITSNAHRSLFTRALHDELEVYNEAVADALDALNGDQ